MFYDDTQIVSAYLLEAFFLLLPSFRRTWTCSSFFIIKQNRPNLTVDIWIISFFILDKGCSILSVFIYSRRTTTAAGPVHGSTFSSQLVSFDNRFGALRERIHCQQPQFNNNLADGNKCCNLFSLSLLRSDYNFEQLSHQTFMPEPYNSVSFYFHYSRICYPSFQWVPQMM